jgi:hypothetical protein
MVLKGSPSIYAYFFFFLLPDIPADVIFLAGIWTDSLNEIFVPYRAKLWSLFDL